MAQAGGSATINGILYQILGNLNWAANIILTAEMLKDDFSKALLIIEPRGGGGDTQILMSRKRIVEQWKAKSKYGTWSLRQVIEEIIPDLYAAVDITKPYYDTEYFFVTEGRRGVWAKASEFFQSLSKEYIPDDPLPLLDNSEKINFFPDTTNSCTKVQLFLLISAEIRKHEKFAGESEKTTHKKLWHLLSRFQMTENVKKEDLQVRIDDFLKGIVEDADVDVRGKRNQLCGIILELASKGERGITPTDLLKKAGLNAESFRNWPLFRNNLVSVFAKALKKKKYEFEKDVRKAPQWDKSFPILILAADSGQGKTWQLSRAAHEVFSKDEYGVSVFLAATGDAGKDFTIAADIIWKQGLNKEISRSLDKVVARKRDVAPEIPAPWLTICVDDVASITEARQLTDYDWQDLGCRLSFSTSVAIGRVIQKEFPDLVRLIELQDFTAAELMDYLVFYNRSWVAIPDDVRKILERPILAKLFVDIAEDTQWTPVNEYELFEKYWSRIKDAHEQINYPNDIALMRQLAEAFLDSTTEYPWSPETLERHGITNDVRKRLETIGWLQAIENNYAQIWHDRLLNWAVAETLVEQIQTNRISIEDVAAKLVEFYSGKQGKSGKSLGYVPMDILWLVSDPTRHLTGIASQLISAIEKTEHGIHSSTLYENMFPTLGDRIIPALLECLRLKIDDPYYPMEIANAFLNFADRFQERVRTEAITILQDSHPALQKVAMKILIKYPNATALNRLWELHKSNTQALYDKDNALGYREYELSFEAFRACLQYNPNWIVIRILESDPQNEPIWELAYQLSNLSTSEAPAIWEKVKKELLLKNPHNKRRGVARCIHRYKDKSEIKWLEECLTVEDDYASHTAFAALCELAPDIALINLPKLKAGNLYPFRYWWLPHLLLRKSDETRSKLIHLMKQNKADLWKVATVYQGNENEMDSITLDMLLDTLNEELRDHFNELKVERLPWLHMRLSLLVSIHKKELLERFEGRASSELENRLVDLAFSWERHDTVSFDYDLHNIKLMLLKIGGDGITKLVNYELAHDNEHTRLNGLKWVLINPDENTKQQLHNIVRYERTGNQHLPDDQYLAIQKIAAIGDDEGLIGTILRWGPKIPHIVKKLRNNKSPMRDNVLREVLATLDQEYSDSCISALIVLGISGRIDFIPKIQHIFLSSPEGSRLALFALIALNNLGDSNSSLIERTCQELKYKENCLEAVNLLLRIGTERALALLKQYIKGKGILKDEVDFKLTERLWILCKDKEELAKAIWKDSMYQPFLSQIALNAIASLDDPKATEFLWNKAFPPAQSAWIETLNINALQALSKTYPEAAFKGALLMLEQTQRDRELLPGLLVKLDEKQSIAILCDQVLKEASTLTRWAIGRSLRKLKPSYFETISDIIKKMMQSDDYRVRFGGVELCGWQRGGYFSSALYKLACDDMSDKVRDGALRAINRQKTEKEVLILMDAFKLAEQNKKWSYLNSILQIGDPILLKTKDDPIWLSKILNESPVYFADYARDILKNRLEGMKKDAAELDKRHGA